MAAINDLIKQIKDPELQARIQREVDKLAKQKKFGLVFEEHLPECTPLYDIPPKPGCNVMLRNSGENKSIYKLIRISDGTATCVNKNNNEDVAEFGVNDIVRVAEFGEPIYPYLKPIDSVCNAPESDLWHTLIEADNYHALQLLEYLYAGKVDCIYIDPPYNTGARDWKYNNDYVDNSDQYRHSKWLSMMEKRLKIAKRILNPDHGIIVLTIDDYEIATITLLMDQIFPNNARLGTIVIKNNPQGRSTPKGFQISHEYALFYGLGNATIGKMPRNESQKGRYKEMDSIGPFEWRNFRAQYSTVTASLIYPIFIKKDGSSFRLPQMRLNDDQSMYISTETPDDTEFESLPYDPTGRLRSWKWSKKTLLESMDTEIGIRKDATKSYSLYYKGRMTSENMTPYTMWDDPRYSASTFGANVLSTIIGSSRFKYPKSIYAVMDCLLVGTNRKKDALIVDFFAGSGTTLHAVNLLNAEDGGHRRCIIVTNNEVSEAEANEMAVNGLKPGDDDWEKLGIARYVTWPRTVCSIEGHDVNGNPLKGNYFGSDLPMADGFKANAAYFKLGFLDKTAVALGMQFKELLPVLWMKAGAIGKCPTISADKLPDMLILPENKFAVLINENAFGQFEEEIKKNSEIQVAFLITDYEVNYQSMAKSLGINTTFQLYRDYLDNFRINYGRN